MTPTRALEELIEARKEAIPGFWKSGYEALSVDANYKADGQIWDMKICDIRGWGHLTGQGHARKLSAEAAKKIQEGNAAFIAQAANFASDHAPALLARVKRLEDALKDLTALQIMISDTSVDHLTLRTAFNCAFDKARTALEGETR